MDVHRAYGFLMRGFRRRRMLAFQRSFGDRESTTILDVGGTPFNWGLIDAKSRITLLNLSVPPDVDGLPPNLSCVVGSGTRLDFEDGSFDVGFSNSMIEYLSSWESQQAFAREIRRVGRSLWVQTPARRFFVEPHLMTPLVHYLPRRWQRRLLRNFTVWGWLARPSRQAVDRFLAETRLLDHKQMCRLFPDCEIRRERFLGFTKSYVAVRRAPGLR